MQSFPFAIGIDIGGTKIAIAVVDSAGRIMARTTLATEAESGFARAVARVAGAIEELRDQSAAGGTMVGIGIGCAGPVDPRRGLINNPYTLTGWNKCDIVTPLRDAFKIPVCLENDADAAILGECWVGAGRGADPVAMLTFGTGVGGAAIFGGVIHRGVHGEHPELGHLAVGMDGPECYCGSRGCLESLASGSAIAAAGNALGFADARQVFSAARRGEPGASAIVQRVLDAVAVAGWTLFHTLLPQRLILGGGMMDGEFELFAGAFEGLDRATQIPAAAVGIAKAELGNDAGLVGAAGLMLRPEAERQRG